MRSLGEGSSKQPPWKMPEEVRKTVMSLGVVGREPSSHLGRGKIFGKTLPKRYRMALAGW